MTFKPICFIAISLSYISYSSTLHDQPGGIIDLNQCPGVHRHDELSVIFPALLMAGVAPNDFQDCFG